MIILAAIPLLAIAASASSHQIPLGRELRINTGSAESGIDVSPFVFTSLQGLLRQWQNVFAPTGHTIIPGTIPAHTLLYHARSDMETPPSPEWFAFDIEMSYGIVSPFGVCIMNTYAATRPINVLYFDGMSAALGGNGTLDSQNVFLYGKVVDDDWDHRPGEGGKLNKAHPGPGAPRGPLQGEYKRAKALCEWANGLEEGMVEGFVRMNAGFELLWCDFNSSSIELVSRLNVTIPAPVNTTSVFGFEQGTEIDHHHKHPHNDCPPPKGDNLPGDGDHPHHCPPPKHEGDYHHNNPLPGHEGDHPHPPKHDYPPKDWHRPPPPKDGHRKPPPSHCHDDNPPPEGHYPPPKGDYPPPKGDHPSPRDGHGPLGKSHPPPDYNHGPPRGDHLPPPKDGKTSLMGEHPPPEDSKRPPGGDHLPPKGSHPPKYGHPPYRKHCPPPKDSHRPPKGDHPHHPSSDFHRSHHPPHQGHWGSVVIEFLRRLSSHHLHHPPPDCHHCHPGHPNKDGHGGHPPCKGKRPPKGHHLPPNYDGDHPPPPVCHRPPPNHCPPPPKDGCPPPDGDKPKTPPGSNHPPPDGDRPPPYGKPPNGTYPHYPHDPRQRSPFSIESRWEWARSATWHYNLAPETRVILDYCRMTSFYNVPIPGRAPAGTPNAKRSHRLKAITPEQAELIKKEVENNLLSYQKEDFWCSGVDWRETADGITRRYFGRIMELRGLLSKAEHLVKCGDRGAELARVTKRIRGLSHAMIMPFFQLSDQDTGAAQKRCMKDYTGHVDVSRVGNSERVLADAVEGVMKNVCKVVFGTYEYFTTPTGEKNVMNWGGEVEALMGWVDWAGWHRCNDACGWNEVCAIPLWPVLGTPWDNGADEELLLNPTCVGIEFMERGNGGWGPGRPPA